MTTEPVNLVVMEETPAPPKPPRRRIAVDSAGAHEIEATGETEKDPIILPVDTKSAIATPVKLKKDTPKSAPPNAAEWQDFLGRIVIKGASNAYLAVMLGDMDLTEQEFRDISLTKEDLAEMSAPLASLATKSTFAQKHGRKIIATGDSFEAVIALVMWGRKVNRIARRHRRAQQGTQQAPQRTEPQVVTGTVIGQNGDQFNGTHGQDGAPNNGFGDGPGFSVYNPGTG
jgi:hypothetical protein